MATLEKNAIKGGELLIRESEAVDIFTPEELTEEQQMMGQATEDFVAKEITPIIEKIDKGGWAMGEELLRKAGELGLLGVSIPEAYGGLGMNFVTSCLIADKIGAAGSFSTTYGAHTGIGTLPILYYGNEEQKQKYIPKLASGEWAACYCLTEPDAGSDANSGKTKAVLSDDGKHYLITGQKMWISNAGYAKIMIVFARIGDDKNITAFIVESDWDGITMNEEEQKLGIKGSSTRQVFFNDVKVPVENMLSERENGFKIAVNILNIGRIKLGIGVLGGAKETITHSINYANDRKQFNMPISKFGAIRHKIAQMTIKTFVTESLGYRAAQDIDDKTNALIAEGMDEAKAKLKGLEQFAIECSIAKVHGSEVLAYVVDEGVQVYGGMGFSEDAPMARGFRDARIARIYEGTNEINRMLLVQQILKRGFKGELDLMGPATAVGKELTSVPSMSAPDLTKPFAAEKIVLENMKKGILMVAGAALQKPELVAKLAKHQELMMNLADMLIEVYAVESTILRAEKLASSDQAELYADIAKVYLHDAIEVYNKAAKEAIFSFADGDEMRVMMLGLKRFTKITPFNLREARQRIAQYSIEKGKYAF